VSTLDPWLVVLAFAGALGSGLMAGAFFAFSTFVMRALARLPAAEGIAAMQSINVAAINAAMGPADRGVRESYPIRGEASPSDFGPASEARVRRRSWRDRRGRGRPRREPERPEGPGTGWKLVGPEGWPGASTKCETEGVTKLRAKNAGEAAPLDTRAIVGGDEAAGRFRLHR
jgi:hypothetical protein